MTDLDAFNEIRTALGMPSISTIKGKSQINADIGNALERVTRRTLASNPRPFSQIKTLEPNSDGEIIVSQFLRVGLPSHLRDSVSILNGKLWDRQQDRPYGRRVEVSVVVDQRFEDIASYQWQRAIILETASDLSRSLDSISVDSETLRQEASLQRMRAFNENPPSLYTSNMLGGFYFHG
jgi:hypothetical protein